MTVAYFDESRATAKAAARPARGFWSRMLDRVIEARMRQAEREVARHRHFAKFDPDAVSVASIWHRPLGD
ncbi:MAG: hypothetical protein K0R27_1738 [Xanthobacteraceae bacterium]|jgi:hypothetical protein|nr:hypothetical protein [Xanthobacteraceae bacterium]